MGWQFDTTGYDLIDWVKVLRPTRHKICHFGDVSSQPVSWLGTEDCSVQTAACVCAYSETEMSNRENNVDQQSATVNSAFLYSEVVPPSQRSQTLASSSASAAASDDLAVQVLKTF